MNAEGWPEIIRVEHGPHFGRPFCVVSYYTEGNGYELEIKKLKASCLSFQLDYFFEGIKSLGSWMLNIHYRPQFLIKAMMAQRRDLVWIDADGVVKQYPALFEALARRADFEIAAHYLKGRELLGGTMYVPNRPKTIELLEAWAEVDARRPQLKEQLNLQGLLAARSDFRLLHLPGEYTKIFDLMAKTCGPAVIEHHQASRRLRKRPQLTTANQRIMLQKAGRIRYKTRPR